MRCVVAPKQSPKAVLAADILIDFYTDTVILDDYSAKWYIWLYIILISII
jgi:hypothetical protein